MKWSDGWKLLKREQMILFTNGFLVCCLIASLSRSWSYVNTNEPFCCNRKGKVVVIKNGYWSQRKYKSE